VRESIDIAAIPISSAFARAATLYILGSFVDALR